jgi:hypothetical protein
LAAIGEDFGGIYSELTLMHNLLTGRLGTITQIRGRLEMSDGETDQARVRSEFRGALFGTATTADSDIQAALGYADDAENFAHDEVRDVAIRLVEVLGHIANARDLMWSDTAMSTVLGHGRAAVASLNEARQCRMLADGRAKVYLQEGR